MNILSWGKFSISLRVLLFLALSLNLTSTICCANSFNNPTSNHSLIADATLPELNQSTSELRNFNFKPDETQTLNENMGVTSSGTFNINGLDKTSNSIIFNKFNGFVVSQINTTLNINNTTITDAQSPSGAVIYNTTNDSSVTIYNSNFTNNTSITDNNDSLGGAIYNTGNLTLINTSFTANSAKSTTQKAKGGAIYSTNSVNMIADSDNVVIVDNYTEDASGKTNNAIYIDNSSTELNITTTNNGNFTLKDDIDGKTGYKVNIDGDNSGTFTMDGNIKNAEINTSNVTVSFANNKIENKQVENLHIGENTYFKLDANLDNSSSDTLTAKNSDGVVKVSELNILQGTTNEEVKLQVLKNTNNVTLNIDKLASNTKSTPDATMYNTNIIANSISLGTTETLNDSIIISGVKDVLYEMYHDTDPTHLIKNFIFKTDSEYNLTKDLGVMPQESILTISNESTSEYGIINANNHSMFELYNPISNINLKNIHIKNAKSVNNGAVANINNSSAELNIQDSLISDNHSDKDGGAIYIKQGTVRVSNTKFTNNTSNGNGGALSVDDESQVVMVNVDFTSNSTTGKGGAIYAKNDVKITADNSIVTFKDNKANGENNAIYVDNPKATVTLEAKENGIINLKDKIDGTEEKYNLNMQGTSTGIINVQETIKNANVNISDVIVNLTEENLMNGNNLTLNNGTISLLNEKVGTASFKTLNTSGKTTLYLDANLENATMDRITAEIYDSIKGTFNVRKINLLSDSKEKVTRIQFADDPIKTHVKNYVSSVTYSKLYKYKVSYNKKTGEFIFNRGNGGGGDVFNPAVMTGAVSNQMAYLTALQNYHTAMYHSKTYMTLPQQIRSTCLTQTNQNPQFRNTPIQEEIKSIWVSPYASFENIQLKNGPKISAMNYGTLFGGDSDMIELDNGFSMVYGGYVGYNGSSYKYENVNASQHGAVIGGTINLYKGNFFNTFTANVGWIINNSNTPYGSDTINNLVIGFADRIGYNIELKSGKFIIQPSLMFGYTFVNSPNFKTSNNVNIKSEPLHAIHFEPTLKMILNLDNGWQPYGIISLNSNFMDNSKLTADSVPLPQMSINTYVEYGIGIQKRWDDKFTGFAQATIRNGGRNGASILFGFRYMLGKIINKTLYPIKDNLGNRKTLFKERKEPEIEIAPIQSRSKNKTVPDNTISDKNIKKKHFDIINSLKKFGKIFTIRYKTDVSAKVLQDVYPNGIIKTNIKGLDEKNQNNSNTIFKDKDLINNDYILLKEHPDTSGIIQKNVPRQIDIKLLNVKNKAILYLNQEKYNELNVIYSYSDYLYEVIDLEF